MTPASSLFLREARKTRRYGRACYRVRAGGIAAIRSPHGSFVDDPLGRSAGTVNGQSIRMPALAKNQRDQSRFSDTCTERWDSRDAKRSE